MLTYKHETPPLESIREFFYRTDKEFDVPLSQKVNVDEYIEYLISNVIIWGGIGILVIALISFAVISVIFLRKKH